MVKLKGRKMSMINGKKKKNNIRRKNFWLTVKMGKK